MSSYGCNRIDVIQVLTLLKQFMNNDDRETLETLTERLNRLTLERNRVIREINNINQRRQEAQAREQRPQRQRQRTRQAERVDVNGTPLHVGDRVRFLTAGRYRSTEGTVHKFGTRFVVSEDDSGNKIAREYGNVERIEEDV